VDLDRAFAVVECSDGGFLLAGITKSFGAGETDLWLVRTDDSGHHLWNRTYGGPLPDAGYQAMGMGDGGFAIAGSTNNFGGGNADFWLVRTDSSGSHLWNYTFGKAGNEAAYAAVSMGGGDFALAGYTDSAGEGKDDAWLVRLHVEPPTTTPSTGTTAPPPIPGFPWLATLSGLVAALTLLLAKRRQAQAKESRTTRRL